MSGRSEPATAHPGGTEPEVSVVIASVNGLPYPLACLDALQAQEGGIPFEVILADCTGPATVAAVRESHPWVRVLAFEERMSVPALRAAGLLEARGRLVAVTEDHCVPRRDWIRRLVEVQGRTGWAVVGGGVENGSVDRVVDWAVYFCEYGHLISPVPPGPSPVIPGMNVAYDMEALTSARHLLTQGLWESFLHDHLRAQGYEMGLDPSIVVSHDKYFTIPMFTGERFHLSRAFAGHRVEGSPLPVRIAWAAGALFLLPLLLIGRACLNVSRRPRYLRRFLPALPLIGYFSLVWSVGEAIGYLTGPGDSMVRIR